MQVTTSSGTRRGDRSSARRRMGAACLALWLGCGSDGPGSTSDGSAGNPAGDAATPQVRDGSIGGAQDAAIPSASDASAPALEKFSFFVTSWAGMQRLSKSANGFGGDLRYGETGEGAGLRGADKICSELAESSMPGASRKQWRAFLSTSAVHAKDRVGPGPWYDRRGRLVAMTLADLLTQRPTGANAEIVDDLPNETGTPNHNPDGTVVDNHDILTGTSAQGTVYSADPACHCYEWTVAEGRGKPRVGHSWPRASGGGGGGGASAANWMSALDEAGCAPGASLSTLTDGPPNPLNPTVGSGGGYGGIYCFALVP